MLKNVAFSKTGNFTFNTLNYYPSLRLISPFMILTERVVRRAAAHISIGFIFFSFILKFYASGKSSISHTVS